MEQLQRLEAGISLLRVIVDAKNDTLVLIRGKVVDFPITTIRDHGIDRNCFPSHENFSTYVHEVLTL